MILYYLHGLSLCIQGTSNFSEKFYPRLRFIPVYTGNIAIDNFSIRKNAVYPCVYREHVLILLLTAEQLRFIPVYTGNMFIKLFGVLQ